MKNLFLVIWGDPKFYQTLIFLSNHLSNNNFKVFILCRNLDHQKDIIGKIYFGKNVKIFKSPNFFLKNINFINYIIFIFFVFIMTLKFKPKNIIFFNKKSLFSIFLLNIFRINSNKIYHNFDFDLINNTKNTKEKILIKLEFYFSKFCNFMVFPSKERILVFKKNIKNYKGSFFSFMNCFPKKFYTKKNRNIENFFKIKKLNNKKIICYLGSIGPNHYLKETIDSLKYLNNDHVLIIAGSPIGEFSNILKDKVKKLNYSDRVFIIENINNSDWFGILSASKVGICFYKQINTSHKYMAGTSQKFNNYLFSNTPMIVNNTKDFKNFKKKYDIYNIANANDASNIAKNIKKILYDKNRRFQLKKNMKIIFNNKLNFEKQFSESYKIIL